MTQVTVIIIGYLLGSLSPSYMLGKLLRGVDIRLHGSGNAGTMNTIKVLGTWPAIVTGFIDTTKGIISMAIAYWLKVPEAFVYGSGFAAIIGHVFPFYLKFKGGQGVATAVGLLLTILLLLIKNQWLPHDSLIIMLVIVLIFFYITKQGEIIGVLILPFLTYEIFYHAPVVPLTIFYGVIILHILLINCIVIFRNEKFKLTAHTKESIIWWRFMLRPGALIFPILYFFISERTLLFIIGIVTLFFIFVDGIRLFHRGINILLFKNVPKIFKEKETGKFSSMTIFLIAAFLTFLLFDRAIASTAILFIIMGDLFGKFFGLQYGKTKVFNKSIEGSLAFFAACLIVGHIFSHYINMPTFVWLLGAVAATISELLPLGIDDNFSVPIVSASTMLVTVIF